MHRRGFLKGMLLGATAIVYRPDLLLEPLAKKVVVVPGMDFITGDLTRQLYAFNMVFSTTADGQVTGTIRDGAMAINFGSGILTDHLTMWNSRDARQPGQLHTLATFATTDHDFDRDFARRREEVKAHVAIVRHPIGIATYLNPNTV